ncbi:MAG: helix-turn-helix domain-containing protein [Faecousia sp.]
MELGEKLRQARLQAGFSQRQLCGEKITRNMLSQIEHGACNPSVDTLCFLARQLGLPVSYFLEEEHAVSSNGSCMEHAWDAFEAGDAAKALQLLEQYRGPDGLLDREYSILKALVLLRLAEANVESGRQVYARKLLNQVQALEASLPWLPEVRQRRLVLQSRLGDSVPEEELRSLDGALLLHASSVLEAGSPVRAAAFLDACEERKTAQWRLLRARAWMAQSEFAAAAKLLQDVEETAPEAALPLLEQCFSALGDYRSAYYYACKQRK